jgi:two-component system, sensor histidine kinase and response regulator
MISKYDTVDLSGLKVLVAESDRLNLIRIYELLTSLGIQVIVTHKSMDAVEKHLIERPDLILISTEMSDRRQLDAIKTIRKNEKTVKYIPIIGLASSIQVDKKTEMNDIAPDDYLMNTFTKKDFYGILEKHISKEITQFNSEHKTQETAPVVFNINEFKDITNSDKVLMDNILNSFVKDIPELIIKLKVAIAAKYFPEIEYFAHSIKGIAANVFAEKLKDTSYHIEIIGKTKDNSKFNDCSALITKLGTDFQEAKIEIEKFLSKKV